MKTSRPITTISFNSEPFLIDKLIEMEKAKIISFWTCIQHKPEDDEGGKKFHYHIYIEPGEKPIEVNTFDDNFIEIDPDNDKPLKTLKFRISKKDDALLYFKHDPDYLASKGQSRKYHYEWDDFITGDEDELYFLIKTINLDTNPYKEMREFAEAGMTFIEFAKNGKVPVQQFNQYNTAWNAITLNLKHELERNKGERHE